MENPFQIHMLLQTDTYISNVEAFEKMCMHDMIESAAYLYETKLKDYMDEESLEGFFNDVCINGSINMVKWFVDTIELTYDDIIEDIFYIVCECGRTEVALFLLNTFNIVMKKENNEYLFVALSNGHIELAKIFIEQFSLLPLLTTKQCNSIFHLHCLHDRIDVIMFMFDTFGYLPEESIIIKGIKVAISNYSHMVIDMFLQNYNDIFKKYRHAIFAWSWGKGNNKFGKYMLENFDDIDFSHKNNFVFRMCCINGFHDNMLFIWNSLMEKGNPICLYNSSDDFEELLIKCAEKGHEVIINFLMDNGICLNEKIVSSMFFNACAHNHIDIANHVKTLCKEKGYELTCKKYSFNNICGRGKADVVKLFLDTFPINLEVEDELFRQLVRSHVDEKVQLFIDRCPQRYKMGESGGIVINLLPISDIEASVKDDDICDCMVCNMVKSNVVTNCGHMFCDKCINKWFNIKETCPYCRTELTMCDRIVTTKIET
jgi:hypothetical protein